jgi:addiction module RelE/StbE family toxin
MTVRFTKRFTKQYDRLVLKDQIQFDNRLDILKANPNSHILRIHNLKGQYTGFRSMNIRGDLRALYKEFDDGSVLLFEFIGTHSQLYG